MAFLHLIDPTVRLLLYTDRLPIGELYETCELNGLTLDQVAASKCGFIASSVIYLLGAYDHRIALDYAINPNKGYCIELFGVYEGGGYTKVSHTIVLLSDGIDWYTYDSYIGSRGLRVEKIHLNTFRSLITALQGRYNPTWWEELTSVAPRKTPTQRISIRVTEFSYTNRSFDTFAQLIERAKIYLESDRGIRDDHICLLGNSKNRDEARSYLNSLYKLCEERKHIYPDLNVPSKSS